MPDSPSPAENIGPPGDGDPHQAISSEDVDEAISALLDGELGGWANERGIDQEAALQLLHAQPMFQERQRTLEVARDAMAATDRDQLDEVTLHRLVRNATRTVDNTATFRTTRAHWYQRKWLRLVAASLVVVLGSAGVAMRIWSTESDTARTVAQPTYAGNFGEIKDSRVLRSYIEGDSQVEALLRSTRADSVGPSPPLATPSREATTDSGSAANESATSADETGGSTLGSGEVPGAEAKAGTARSASQPSKAIETCTKKVGGRLPAQSTIVLVADAVLHGAPVVVTVVHSRDKLETNVLDPRSCSAIATQSQKLTP